MDGEQLWERRRDSGRETGTSQKPVWEASCLSGSEFRKTVQWGEPQDNCYQTSEADPGTSNLPRALRPGTCFPGLEKWDQLLLLLQCVSSESP